MRWALCRNATTSSARAWLHLYDAPVANNSARIAELTADLAATRGAIRKIVETGQAYSAEGRSMNRADLGALRMLEESQAKELRSLERGSGPRVFGAIYR